MFKIKNTKKYLNHSSLVIFVVVFVAAASYFLLRSFAATPPVASVEAETMSLPPGATVQSDSNASSGKTLRLTQNGTTEIPLNLPAPAVGLTVTARADQCSGSPTFTVAVDGVILSNDMAVTSTVYGTYSAATNLASGSHQLKITASNLGSEYRNKTKIRCSRVLYIDVTTFSGAASTPTPPPTPPPAPTPPPTSSPTPVGVSGAWSLAFDDEFDGTSLDTTKWSPNWFGDGGKMNNVGTYASNVTVAGGNLLLQLASSTSGALIHTDYSAGRYQLPVGGYTEARISFPGATGEQWSNWPAWWASGSNWPSAGEHDIAEGLGGTPTVNYHSPSGPHNFGTIAGVWGDTFHTYGVYRKAASADVYWDGQLVKSYPTDDNGIGEELIINLGVTTGKTPQIGTAGQVKVDYVRAWKQ